MMDLEPGERILAKVFFIQWDSKAGHYYCVLDGKRYKADDIRMITNQRVVLKDGTEVQKGDEQ